MGWIISPSGIGIELWLRNFGWQKGIVARATGQKVW
jgi:hypothetical protein